MVDALYIHIPFCIRKCNYCDFLSFQSTQEERRRYVDNLIKEIKLYPKISYDTVYFGGGTPSLLEPSWVKKILSNITLKPKAEVTLEVNPATVDKEKLKALKEAGINRLSIGFQSFNKKYLEVLGRLHSLEEGLNTYKMARELGYENISIDLMFSLPNETIDELKEDLKTLFDLNPEHFSIYSLIWEEGTVFYKKLLKGEYEETDNDIEADMYELIINEAKKNGYLHYEISNFAKAGKESRHNSKYWENAEYIGIGLGASGYYNDIRYKNYSDIKSYYETLQNQNFPIEEKEEVNEELKEEYRHILGLRLLNKGIKKSNEEKYQRIYSELIEEGYIETSDSKRYILNDKGVFLANEVFEKFI